MSVSEIQQLLETSPGPIARVFHKMDNAKVLLLGFKAGMKLKEHQAHVPSKLLVIYGKVNFVDSSGTVPLLVGEHIDIPIEVIHSVEAEEDSMCILTQG